jgi:SAM-dependent methyltransferase
VPEVDVGQRYTEVADLYIRMFGAVDRVAPQDLSFLERNLGDSDGTVLDAGCGPGHLAAYLTGLGLTVQGVDLVPEFIGNARANWPGVDFAVGSVHTLDMPDRSLGAILAWFSLIHCEPAELTDVLTEFRRVVRRGGMLVVGFFEGACVERFDHKVAPAYRWPVDEMSRMLSAAGFAETERCRRSGTAQTRPYAALAARAA